MKIKDILKESPTDLVARYHHTDESEGVDKAFNLAADEYSKSTRDYYEEFFKGGITPVFKNTSNIEVDEDIEDWSNKPLDHELQSPGYRGQQYLFKRSDLPHDKNIQDYNPQYFNSDDVYDGFN